MCFIPYLTLTAPLGHMTRPRSLSPGSRLEPSLVILKSGLSPQACCFPDKAHPQNSRGRPPFPMPLVLIFPGSGHPAPTPPGYGCPSGWSVGPLPAPLPVRGWGIAGVAWGRLGKPGPSAPFSSHHQSGTPSPQKPRISSIRC